MPIRKKRRFSSFYLPAIGPEVFSGKNGNFLARRLNEYLARLFKRRSPPLDLDTLVFLCFALGRNQTRRLCGFMRDNLSPLLCADFEEELEESDDGDDVASCLARFLAKSPKAVRRRFEKELKAALADRVAELETDGSSQVQKNIETIAEIFELSPDERRLLVFLLILFVFDEAEHFFMSRLSCDKPFFRQNMATLLNMGRERLGDALFGKLHRMKIIDVDSRSLSLNDSFVEILENPEKALTSRKSFLPAPGGDLRLDEHLIDSRHTRILELLLREKRESSTHVLLYGPPGTGKTSYARALVQSLGVPAYEVAVNDQNSSVVRRGSVLSCIHFTNGGDGSVVIVDEADSLLGTRRSWFEAGETRDKGWVNHFLEREGLRMIWIVNELCMDDSIYRRFSYSVQFHPFTRRQRIVVWQNVLKRHALARALPAEDLETLATRYRASAGGIEMAVRKAREAGIAGWADLVAFFERTLTAHMTLMNDGARPRLQEGVGRDFLVDALNVDEDLPRLFEKIQAWDQRAKSSNLQDCGPMTLLFHGPPGTGKSETAKYLAEILDRDLMACRASDILDMYVGGTERNLASIFARAEDSGAVLLIDEADSFMIDRRRAVRSWEISATNEFLGQLENFGGIAICTTNRMSKLDQAAFRRFGRKIAFDYLAAEGNLAFYEKFLAPLATGRLEKAQRRRLADLSRLAPGDFKVVRQRRGLDAGQGPTHAELIDDLETESRYKEGDKPGTVRGFAGGPTLVLPATAA